MWFCPPVHVALCVWLCTPGHMALCACAYDFARLCMWLYAPAHMALHVALCACAYELVRQCIWLCMWLCAPVPMVLCAWTGRPVHVVLWRLCMWPSSAAARGPNTASVTLHIQYLNKLVELTLEFTKFHKLSACQTFENTFKLY